MYVCPPTATKKYMKTKDVVLNTTWKMLLKRLLVHFQLLLMFLTKPSSQVENIIHFQLFFISIVLFESFQI